jgi:hypothetical protein
MKVRLKEIADRIRSELQEIEILVKRIELAWQHSLNSEDEFYLDSVALNLHGFYSGIERIFEIISTNIDANKPSGENWHQQLLNQMADEIPSVRPAVISTEIYAKLNEFRGFRHIVRNVYTFRFDPNKIENLVNQAPTLFFDIKQELLAFADFLEDSTLTE